MVSIKYLIVMSCVSSVVMCSSRFPAIMGATPAPVKHHHLPRLNPHPPIIAKASQPRVDHQLSVIMEVSQTQMNHQEKQKQILQLIKTSGALSSELYSETLLGNHPKFRTILDLYHHNQTVKDQLDELDAFGIFSRDELLCIENTVKSTDNIIGFFEENVDEGLQLIDSLKPQDPRDKMRASLVILKKKQRSSQEL